ncbi:MAG: putative peptidoglycan glycosyltransferase FtsW [Pseudomonadota bacterium]
MNPIARTDRSLVGQWFWTVDHWLIMAILLLMVTGAVLTSAASPPAAMRIGQEDFYFVKRHFVFLPITVAMVVGLSLLKRPQVTAFCLGLLGLSLALTVGTLFIGQADDGMVNGAARWIRVGGLSLQPSELIKPSFIVVTAWLFCLGARNPKVPGLLIVLGLLAVITTLLIRQPDLGMTMLILAGFIIQLYLAGMPVQVVMIPCGVLVAILAVAYATFDHVAQRIDRFLSPAASNPFDQIAFALKSFGNGGWTGTGPGDGRFKQHLPDAHTDFIFAVVGEEFGFFGCFVLIALLGFVVLRGLTRLARQDDLFITIAAGGLLAQFGLQALINMASAVALIPTKGMTLPFLSYGGSSLLSVGITMGLVLALTRRSAMPQGAS